MTVGILAFGSLVDDPGREIAQKIRKRVKTTTPFLVEFARISTYRKKAPTLVPVSQGGATVVAELLVLVDTVDFDESRNMLYRREINHVGSSTTYTNEKQPSSNSVLIRELRDFLEVDWVVYTDFPAAGKRENITPK